MAEKTGASAPPDNAYYDQWHHVAGLRHRPEHVVLVTIDEASLSRNSDPLVFWTPQVAQVARSLLEAGATVVGVDLLFSISPETWLMERCPGTTAYDVPLREELAGGRVVMVGSRVATRQGYDGFLLASPDYLLALPDLDMERLIGLSDLVADADAGVRRFVAQPTLNLPPEAVGSNLPKYSLAPLLALHATSRGSGAAIHDGIIRRIPYAGPPGTFPRISFDDVLKGTARDRWPDLKDKVVIIGAEYLSANDYHPTPYSSGFFLGRSSLMSGPEVHANIAEAILSARQLTELGTPARAGIGMIVFVLTGIAFLCLPLRMGSIALTVALLLPPMVSFWLFLQDVWLPIAGYQLGLAGCFLSATGYRLTTGEREKTRIRRLFSRYVSDQVVDVLLASGRPVELGGTKQTITVLFSDIRNFTTLSERLDAHEIVEMLNEYFERSCDAVMAEGGTIDKFVGDAIMVEFGAPLPFADHAQRAIRAALAMASVADDFRQWMNLRFPDHDLPEFRIGIGLHTGIAVVGNIGSSKRTEYTAIGDTVNVASRIEGQTKDLGCAILASRETIEAAAWTAIGKTATVQITGRDTSIEVHEVLNPAKDSPRDA